MDEELLRCIRTDPSIMVGKPAMRGARIPVELILREYRRFQPEDIRAALAYTARVLSHEDVFPLTAPVNG